MILILIIISTLLFLWYLLFIFECSSASSSVFSKTACTIYIFTSWNTSVEWSCSCASVSCWKSDILIYACFLFTLYIRITGLFLKFLTFRSFLIWLHFRHFTQKRQITRIPTLNIQKHIRLSKTITRIINLQRNPKYLTKRRQQLKQILNFPIYITNNFLNNEFQYS